MAYKRWYDSDHRLSMVVRAMEFMNLNSQLRFAQKLLELSESLLVNRGGENYMASLDDKKQQGLNKSQDKKRWYDRYETLHRAFNNLYALPNEDRREIAARLVTPIEIVEGYEKHCKRQEQEPDARVIEEVLRSCFAEGPDRARKLYSIYLYDFSGMVAQTTSGKPGSASRSSQSVTEDQGLWASLLQNIKEALSTA